MSSRNIGIIVVGLGIALAVALISPLASGDPDGLERVAEDEGFIETAEEPRWEILPDYSVPGIENEAVSTILSGVIGVAIVAALTYGVAVWLRRGGREADPPEGAASAPEQAGTPRT